MTCFSVQRPVLVSKEHWFKIIIAAKFINFKNNYEVLIKNKKINFKNIKIEKQKFTISYKKIKKIGFKNKINLNQGIKNLLKKIYLKKKKNVKWNLISNQ